MRLDWLAAIFACVWVNLRILVMIRSSSRPLIWRKRGTQQALTPSFSCSVHSNPICSPHDKLSERLMRECMELQVTLEQAQFTILLPISLPLVKSCKCHLFGERIFMPYRPNWLIQWFGDHQILATHKHPTGKFTQSIWSPSYFELRRPREAAARWDEFASCFTEWKINVTCSIDHWSNWLDIHGTNEGEKRKKRVEHLLGQWRPHTSSCYLTNWGCRGFLVWICVEYFTLASSIPW